MDFVLPILIIAVLLAASIRRVEIISSFANGVKNGISTIRQIFPSLLIMLTVIGMFRASGALDAAVSIISPLTEKAGLPAEALSLAMIRPFSGSGAIAVLEDILKKHGADSYTGLIGSVMCAATETTLYTLNIYLGSSAKFFFKLLFCALLADIISIIMSVITVNLILT